MNIFDLLSAKNRTLYIDMLDCLRRGSAEVLKSDDDGVILRHKTGGMLLMAPFTDKGAEEMADIENTVDVSCVIHGGEYLPVFEKNKIRIYCKCYQVDFRMRQDDVILPEGVKVVPLDRSYARLITDTYSNSHGDIEYITERLDSGVMVGLFEGNELCGYIGQHDDNSIGLLEILEGHKRKGYGTILEEYMINKVWDSGCMPYCQVIVENELAKVLHRKRKGVSISEDVIAWSGRED